jgi:hypothetical protein
MEQVGREKTMRALVVYESMYGNTQTVADCIGDGLRSGYDVTVASVRDATAAMVQEADLLVAGGPTHAHGMSRPSTRKAAADAAQKQPDLTFDPNAAGPGLREWLEALPDGHGRAAAAFDTRVRLPGLVSGRAGRRIARRLRRHGYRLAVGPESFFVDKTNHLLGGESDRARAWGEGFAGANVTSEAS